MQVGDMVTLTPQMMRAATEPEKYQSGTVTGIGTWGIVYVQFNGIHHPIGVRSDEIMYKEGGDDLDR